MGGECSEHRHMTKATKIIISNPETKRALEIPRTRWQKNIKSKMKECGFY
jgi:hypothetical protein